MYAADHIYHHGQLELQGFLAHDNTNQPKPAVLIFHDWSGRNEFACQKATMMVELGYVGFSVDMFGHAKIGKTTEEKSTLITPFVQDRTLLAARVKAAYDVVRTLPQVDNMRIAAIGFCFGGLCALDLARLGTTLKAAISFHGLLNRPESLPICPIEAKILALHGYDDPMVPPQQVQAFCEEMTQAKADWQVHMYGNTQHAFTNPQAHDTQLGTIYNAVAADRAFESMRDLLREVFGG